jgi:hypothetical protein
VLCERNLGAKTRKPETESGIRNLHGVAVTKPFIQPTGDRKRGNPNWGKPMKPVAEVPTAFEEQVQELGLTEQTCVVSEELRQWCKRNKDRCYIPEWLLKQWGTTVDPNLGG